MIAKRIVLITGANKGIGLETARQLGAQGHTIILAAREQSRGIKATEELTKLGIDAHFVHLDVTDTASIKKASEWVSSHFGKVDTLINNAGTALEPFGTKASETDLSTWRKIFDVNVFGLAEVTQAFLPLVKNSQAGRIVNLSSVLGSLALHAEPKSPIYNFKATAYDCSKSAVNQYTIHLAHELKDTNIKVNSAHPGWVKTDLGGQKAPMEIPDGAKTSVWLATLPDDGPTGGFFHMQERLPW
jgi:NAD(P)-dependent dehydrogenase (short-subunit alcohol dehydrogenase family)